MNTGGGVKPIAELIDDLLGAQKSLSGTPFWQDGNRVNHLRFVWPILVEGETANMNVSATAKLETSDLNFSISLNAMGESIWRLDHDLPHRMHTNNLMPGNPLSGLQLYGPHYHAWADNRHKATKATLPKTLDWRQELPSGFRTWEAAFRWFLGRTKIDQPRSIPGYPARTTLAL